ncbi:MAG: hypothetical protein ACR2HG_03115 [Pyrinomonadaceae bacterium]
MKKTRFSLIRQLFVFVLVLTFFGLPAEAANCSNTSTGLIPLTQLGAGTYQGFTGGLYPFGSNLRPTAHELAGIEQSYQVRPRDGKGLPKPNGKIVLLTIGMSNTTQESSVFIPLANADPQKSDKVTIIDGAQGGMSADKISDLTTQTAQQFWLVVAQRLAAANLTAKQVQVVWLKEADDVPLLTFPANALRLKSELQLIAQIIKQKYPNTRMIFLSSRSYGGYADSQPTRGEPVSYQTGFADKWLIEDQINGSPDLNFDARLGEVKAPWLSWGAYLWADGTTPRNDGLFYVCSDYQSDGVHPATGARNKIANLLLDFFKTDSIAKRWFLKPAIVSGT